MPVQETKASKKGDKKQSKDLYVAKDSPASRNYSITTCKTCCGKGKKNPKVDHCKYGLHRLLGKCSSLEIPLRSGPSN
jgi:hypothetical protein